MIKSFDLDFGFLWHARTLACLALALFVAFSIAVKIVFGIELR